MTPLIKCAKCINFKDCEYVKELKKASKDPDNVYPVLYSPCPSYKVKGRK